jgi:nucleoside-diphosphate-sugar epimerase
MSRTRSYHFFFLFFLKGLGHVEDLAVAMANCIGRESITNGKVYNCQNTQAITFDGVAKAAGKVLGKEVEIIHYNPKEFTFPEGKKVRTILLLVLTDTKW